MASMKTGKVNRKPDESDISVFTRECKKLAGKMNLLDWDISVVERKLSSGNAAETDMQPAGRIALIVLNKDHDKDIDLHRLAAHEVSHIFLMNLSMIAESRWAQEADWDLAIESACTVLEKLL